MKLIKIDELFKFLKKSKLKAKDGKEKGKYNMYSSSMLVDKYLESYQFENEALVFGTGGNASIHHSYGMFSTTADCYVLEIKTDNILTKYVYKYLKGNIHILEEGFKGAGLKHINQKYIKQIKIPVPAINIQKQIVEILDEAQFLIDNRKEQMKFLDDLIKSVFYDMFGNPIINNEEWKIKKLGELGKLSRGRSKHRPRNDASLYGGEYPFIQTGDVSNAGIYLEEYKTTYSEKGLKQSKMWSKGTLCITIAANIAKTSILKIDACFPDSVVGFISNEESNVTYIRTWFTFFQEIIEKSAPKSAQRNINLRILNDLDVIAPPIELQNRFAEKVEEIESQKQLLEESLKLLEDNYKSLMQRAFKGQLF